MNRTFFSRKLWIALALLTGVTAALTVTANAQTVTLRAGASEAKGMTAPALVMDKLAEVANTLSNGQLNIQMFYTTLGVEQQLIQSVKAGSVDIGEISTSNVTRFTDAFLQFDLPFLFKDDKIYLDVLKSHPAGKKAIAQFEKDLGVKLLLVSSQGYDAEATGTDLQTRDKAVRVPADIKGLKLRTGSTPAEIALMKAYGANPTPVDWAQLYSALQQGVVDGTVAVPLAPFVGSKLYEVAKHYMAIGFRHNVIPIYINQRKFDSLSPAHQKILLEAAAEAEKFNGEYARKLVKSSADELSKVGIKIYHPTKAEMDQWLSVRQQVWEQIANEYKGKIDLALANEIYKLNQ